MGKLDPPLEVLYRIMDELKAVLCFNIPRLYSHFSFAFVDGKDRWVCDLDFFKREILNCDSFADDDDYGVDNQCQRR